MMQFDGLIELSAAFAARPCAFAENQAEESVLLPLVPVAVL